MRVRCFSHFSESCHDLEYWPGKHGVEQVRHILEALAVTTGMIVIKDRQLYEFEVKASVDIILEAMIRASKEELSPAPPIESSSGKTKNRGSL